MANFIVGDIQGCFSALQEVLKKAKFNPKRDKLWSVGDLVGRGNQALETIEYLYSLKDSFDTVLGNHDLHLLAVNCGIRKAKAADGFDALLTHPSFPTYAAWLRSKSLALKVDKFTLIAHAGLYPKWSIDTALALSDEVRNQLLGKQYQDVLQAMYGDGPSIWSEKLSHNERLRFIINAFTRMRFVKPNYALEFDCKDAPDQAPKELLPWFALKNKQLGSRQRVIFGHWAALNGETASKQFIGLDTGFVWGGSLTLYCLENKSLIQVKNKD